MPSSRRLQSPPGRTGNLARGSSFLRFLLARIACAYTSARSIGFCAIWVCISSSSSSEAAALASVSFGPVLQKPEFEFDEGLIRRTGHNGLSSPVNTPQRQRNTPLWRIVAGFCITSLLYLEANSIRSEAHAIFGCNRYAPSLFCLCSASLLSCETTRQLDYDSTKCRMWLFSSTIRVRPRPVQNTVYCIS